ncbi:hypothetical protein DPV79_27075 [Burkholderia reimsis]|uniref:Uncharacterized protein n=1 Tax=Burkholderia reimsis TaxID=2234132 RepID=A0A365QNT8_9BURK|nr:hypothetical protein [Burkholderia reimsis]RBB35688.1 hypothetical protein DPV79_27075 [Burkholderia reimsis]
MNGLNIGIDDNTSLFYEGSLSLYGHAIWPSPFMSLVSHIGELAAWRRDRTVVRLTDAPMLFREDSFDPVARVRRGRLYIRRQQVNPANWRVQRHPAYATSGLSISTNGDGYGVPDERGFFSMELTTFESWRVSEEFLKKRRNAVLVMGSGDRAMVHSVLDVERLATGEELITVRTRPSLSGLPELIVELIPEAYRKLVLEQYEKAASSAFRDDAESVIDRCREAATAALHAERDTVEEGKVAKVQDLAKLGDFFSSQTRDILGNTAKILARMHSRGKSAEQIKRDTMPPSEADAETSIALLGMIYRELRWTR